MDLSITPPSTSAQSARHAALWWRLAQLVRYRFFLFAGLLPYLLGTVWAYTRAHRFDAGAFWMALAGVAFAVIGVEAFNDYFDARLGTDRVFNWRDAPPMPRAVFWLGAAAFAAGLAVAVYLMRHVGGAVLVFALLGGAAAMFYEAPPIRWSYHGLGEIVIGLAYGPGLVLGSVYLQMHRVSWDALWLSLVPGLLLTALAIVNAIPDYHQDRLVGKRNLVVRLGRRRAVWLYVALAGAALVAAVAGVGARRFPTACLSVVLAAPLLAASVRDALRFCEQPRRFTPAIRSMLVCYLLVVSLLAAGVLLRSH